MFFLLSFVLFIILIVFLALKKLVSVIRRLLLTSRGDLVVVTESMVIGQFRVEPDGTVSETSRVKLSTRTKENHLAWAGDSHLAVSSGDTSVRIWNLRNDANFVLTVDQVHKSLAV